MVVTGVRDLGKILKDRWTKPEVDALLEGLAQRVVEQRARAGEARELGDARAHRPGADDADDLGYPGHEGTSALMPVSARPMISFWIWEVPS